MTILCQESYLFPCSITRCHLLHQTLNPNALSDMDFHSPFKCQGQSGIESVNSHMSVGDITAVNGTKGKCVWLPGHSVQLLEVPRLMGLEEASEAVSGVNCRDWQLAPAPEAAWRWGWGACYSGSLFPRGGGQSIWSQRWSGTWEPWTREAFSRTSVFTPCDPVAGAWEAEGRTWFSSLGWGANREPQKPCGFTPSAPPVGGAARRVRGRRSNTVLVRQGWVEELCASLFFCSRSFFNTGWRAPRKANQGTKISDTFRFFCGFLLSVHLP